jgi:hypothetical protein
VCACAYLCGGDELVVDVRVAGSWVYSVLTKVLVDIFWRGLRKETIQTLSEKKKRGRERE